MGKQAEDQTFDSVKEMSVYQFLLQQLLAVLYLLKILMWLCGKNKFKNK